MNLTAKQFSSVVAPIQGAVGKGGKEHRRANRTMHRCRIQIALADGTELLVTSRDISPRGIGLLHSEPLSVGTQFIINMQREGKFASKILCTVSHCRKQAVNVYSIGAEFTCLVNVNKAADAADGDEVRRIQKSMLG